MLIAIEISINVEVTEIDSELYSDNVTLFDFDIDIFQC